MELKMLSFVGCVLCLLFHCASAQPSEFDNDVSHLEDSIQGVNHTQSELSLIHPIKYTKYSGCNLKDYTVYYRIPKFKATWFEARKMCHLEGGILGYPDCKAEAKFYLHRLSRKDKGAWMGLHDMFEEGKWVTLFDDNVDDLDFVNWSPGQPNNFRSENCAEMYHTTGEWHDSDCNAKLHFICKRYVPVKNC